MGWLYCFAGSLLAEVLRSGIVTDRPNVVVMLADNVGVGGLSCYGGTVPTPRLDRLAAEGVRFTNFNTEAQCTPTRSALLTGRMPIRSGTFRVPLPGEPGDYGLAPWEYTAAELFSDAGYATACFGKWHLGNAEGRLPTDQGFDEWWGITESSDEASYSDHPQYPDDWEVPKIHEGRKGEPQRAAADFNLQTRPFMDEGITERSIDFINRNAAGGRPFFLYAPFTNVHPPMLAHPDFADISPAEYVANMAELDARAGQILDALDEAGVADNTIVVWLSDNAAALLDGRVFGSNGPWRGMFGGSWEGSMRSPAMVRWPGHIPQGVVTDEIVATYDWLPTLAALVGEVDRLPTDRPIDGVDMSAFLLGDTDTSSRDSFVFIGTDGEPWSVKWKNFKVHFQLAVNDKWTSPIVKPQIPSVYDLTADPTETVNLMESELTLSWVVKAAMQPLVELAQSTNDYPHIPPGADFTGY